jgi:hypothetical protein
MKRSIMVSEPKPGSKACAAAPPHIPSRAHSAGRTVASKFAFHSWHHISRQRTSILGHPSRGGLGKPIRVKPAPSKTKNYQTNPFCDLELFYNHNGLSPSRTKPSQKTNPFRRAGISRHIGIILFFPAPTIQRCSMLAFYILHSSFFIAFQLCPVVPGRSKIFKSKSLPPKFCSNPPPFTTV